ncbi:MAG: hypothetical protein WKG06_01910 [Segetibacter sp.]
MPSTQVPKGKTPEDNVVVREGGVKPTLAGRCSTTLGTDNQI